MIRRAVRAAALVAVLAAPTAALAEATQTGTGAVLRGLDKMTDESRDISLRSGTGAELGNLVIELHECRYPAGNPTGEAYASLTIRDRHAADAVVFSGWMVASSPALNPLEHRRYDIWVLDCLTS